MLFNFKFNLTEFKFYFKCLLFLFVSISLNLAPCVLSREVVVKGFYFNSPNSTNYEIIYEKAIKEEFNNACVQWILMSLILLKDPVCLVLFCSVNITIGIVFRNQMKKKKKFMIKSTSSLG